MSASISGQKFLTTREKAWNQYMTEAQLKQEQDRNEMQRVAQVAQVAEGMYKQRQAAQAQQRIQAIKSAQSAEDRAFQTWKLLQELGVKREDLEQKWAIHQDQMSAKENEQKDPLFDTATKQVRAEMKGAGIDPDDPGNAEFLNRESTRIANELFATRQMLEEKYKRPRNAGGMTMSQLANMYQLKEIKNGYGDVEFRPVNKLTGTPVNAQPWEEGGMPDFSPEQVSKFNGIQNSVDSMRSALRSAMNAKAGGQDPTGKFVDALPLSVRSVMGTIPANERNMRVLFNAAVSQYMLGMSGVAVSAHEEKRVMGGLPKFFEKMENFVPGALAFTNMMEGALLRSRAGIDPGQLDLSDVFDSYNGWLQDQLKAGKVPKHIKTGDELLEIAAKEKGFEVLRDGKGRPRGIRKVGQ
jgi:hypothetical protein